MLPTVLRSSPVDGFHLAYERIGSGSAVVLLHGWPGDHADYREVAPLLSNRADVLIPDLRGFGVSDKHQDDAPHAYSAPAQVRSVVGLMEELSLTSAVIGGYDIGSRIAQTIARIAPDRVRALVISPPLPGVGERVLSAGAHREFWYQAFHQLELAAELIDGNTAAVRAYLRHFWSHWSGPGYRQPDADLDRLVDAYGPPGAFTASIGWYRAGSGTVASSIAEVRPAPDDRISVPACILWPEHDPLFPPAWADRLSDFFVNATVRQLPGVGHFVPLEAPEDFATAIRDALDAGNIGDAGVGKVD
jgi:pimeloyl-ACP methyl ester carboxylesterase